MRSIKDVGEQLHSAERLRQVLMSLLSLLVVAIFATITFLVAGTWQLPFFWAVFAIQATIGLASVYLLDPDLLSERLRPRGKDEDPLARVILSILWLLVLVFAALDVGRWHFSDHVPATIQMIGVLLHGIGWVGFLWSMQVNRYFSSAIRLQPDRHQQVVTSGPYHWIRHPGYVFASLTLLSQSIALGSLISMIPAMLIVADLIYRTMLEERMLIEGLSGYKEYAARVRFRWLPGIW